MGGMPEDTSGIDQSVSPENDELPFYLNAASTRLLQSVKKAILTDPGLPRANPTISSWQVPEHPTVASAQSAVLPQRTDFAVIGSGITGCSVTKALLEHPAAQNSHVTVFEARTLVSGATGRNGGHLVTASGHTYGPLAKQHGSHAAKQITRFSILNIDRLIQLVKSMDPSIQKQCQFRDVLKVMAVRDSETWAASRESVLEFQDNVPEHSEYHRIIEKDNVAGRWNIQNAQGAVEHEAGAIWPYRLLTKLYEAMLRDSPERLSIETNTPVSKVSYSPDVDPEYPYAVTTSRGIVRARRVLHCTNAYASHLLPRLAGGIYPFRGTMSVQKPGPELKNLGACRSWSLSHKSKLEVETGFYDTGLYYLQQNALTGHIWIGNESAYLKDILTADDTYVPDEAKEFLSTVLPGFFLKGWGGEEKSEVEAIWSGIQGHTADGLPIVGRVPQSITGEPGDTGQWIAAGFNGYGMDKCWLTGEALAKMIMGEDVSDWFPQCYTLTERRLQQTLTANKTVLKFAKIALPDGAKTAKI